MLNKRLLPLFCLTNYLYFYADLTINEIAAITNLSKNEVKKRINNSKNNIFDTLDKEEANNGK